MPAIDNLFGNGAIHIADRNKKNPITTLCGQALDKETIRFFEDVTNFDQATCKVCRKSFFDEDWSGSRSDDTQSSEIPRVEPAQQQAQETPQESAQEGVVQGQVVKAPVMLFGALKAPVNQHQSGEKSDGD